MASRKPRTWKAWGMIDKHTGELSYVCDPKTNKDSAMYEERLTYEKLIRVEIREIKPEKKVRKK